MENITAKKVVINYNKELLDSIDNKYRYDWKTLLKRKKMKIKLRLDNIRPIPFRLLD